jgi:hypothetical protein
LLERLKGATHQVFVAVFQSPFASRYFLPFSSRKSPVATRCSYYEPLIEVPGL